MKKTTKKTTKKTAAANARAAKTREAKAKPEVPTIPPPYADYA